MTDEACSGQDTEPAAQDLVVFTEESLAAFFGPAFFLGQLGAFALDHCPAPEHGQIGFDIKHVPVTLPESHSGQATAEDVLRAAAGG